MSAHIDSIREKSNKAEQDGIKVDDVQMALVFSGKVGEASNMKGGILKTVKIKRY